MNDLKKTLPIFVEIIPNGKSNYPPMATIRTDLYTCHVVLNLDKIILYFSKIGEAEKKIKYQKEEDSYPFEKIKNDLEKLLSQEGKMEK